MRGHAIAARNVFAPSSLLAFVRWGGPGNTFGWLGSSTWCPAGGPVAACQVVGAAAGRHTPDGPTCCCCCLHAILSLITCGLQVRLPCHRAPYRPDARLDRSPGLLPGSLVLVSPGDLVILTLSCGNGSDTVREK